MQNMKPPSIPEIPVPVLNQEELGTLLKTAEGRDFVSRRDMAILRMLIDTGMRRGELAGLKVEDIDFDQDVAYMIKRHLYGVLNYFSAARITNAAAEGLNSKIQTIKKMAYGYRNREHFKTAIFFHCGGLQLYPATHGLPG